jgi:hypothetical protein
MNNVFFIPYCFGGARQLNQGLHHTYFPIANNGAIQLEINPYSLIKYNFPTLHLIKITKTLIKYKIENKFCLGSKFNTQNCDMMENFYV